jgi:hypothetical protein
MLTTEYCIAFHKLLLYIISSACIGPLSDHHQVLKFSIVYVYGALFYRRCRVHSVLQVGSAVNFLNIKETKYQKKLLSLNL